jgi:hypothetical protein
MKIKLVAPLVLLFVPFLTTPAGQRGTGVVTFSETIAPIVYQNCSSPMNAV